MHIELNDDVTLQMEIDYGGIKILRRYDINNIRLRRLIFLHRAYGKAKKAERKRI